MAARQENGTDASPAEGRTRRVENRIRPLLGAAAEGILGSATSRSTIVIPLIRFTDDSTGLCARSPKNAVKANLDAFIPQSTR